jgi:hypothetical protein
LQQNPWRLFEKPRRSDPAPAFAFTLACLALPPERQCKYFMKSLSVGLPEPLVADIEAESRGRKISKSDVVCERLERVPRQRPRAASLMPSPTLSDRWMAYRLT